MVSRSHKVPSGRAGVCLGDEVECRPTGVRRASMVVGAALMLTALMLAISMVVTGIS